MDFSNSKLEYLLAEYEKAHPIGSKQDLIRAIEKIIASERQKDNSSCDAEMISEAEMMILSLKGYNINEVIKNAEESKNRFKEKIVLKDKPVIHKRSGRIGMRRAAVVLVAVISIVMMTTIIASAFGFDIVDFVSSNVRYILSLSPGDEIADGVTLVQNQKQIKYDSIEELMEAQNIKSLLYPKADTYDVEQIFVVNYGNYTEYFVTDSGESALYSVSTAESQITDDYKAEQYNGYELYVLSRDGQCQIIFRYGDYEYCIFNDTYENSIKIIDSLEVIEHE